MWEADKTTTPRTFLAFDGEDGYTCFRDFRHAGHHKDALDSVRIVQHGTV
jgi:hypothetical protein